MHTSHYEFAVKALRLPHMHRSLHIPLFLSAGFSPSSVTSLQAFLHFLPGQTHGFAVIPTHHASSCIVPGLSDSVYRYSKPSLKSRNCSTVLLQYHLQIRDVPQSSKTHHFAQPVIIFAVLNHPATHPLVRALSLTRHSFAKQAVVWL